MTTATFQSVLRPFVTMDDVAATRKALARAARLARARDAAARAITNQHTRSK